MSRPDFSVVIPTLNEAEHIGATLVAARAALGVEAELIVVDGGSHDETVLLAAAAGARVLHAAGGRGAQLDRGARAACGRAIVFVHADTLLPPDAGQALHAALAAPDVVGGAFRVRFTARGAARLPWAARLLARWMAVRTRWLGMATGDQAIFARSAALTAAGGVERLPLFEDVRLFRALRRQGGVRLLDATVTTSARRFVQAGAWRTIMQHVILRLLHRLGAPPERLARHYPPVSAGSSAARSRSARSASSRSASLRA